MKIVDLSEEQVDYIENSLDEYDEKHINYKLEGRIQIGIEEGGRIVAGLDACMTAFKILYVSTVFVDENYRRNGYGKDFYDALGYQMVGSYDNEDDGYSEYFFLKRI